MLLTESPGWNGLLALKLRLSPKLARFVRTTAPSTPVDSRRRRNDAAFLDADLRYILHATPVELPEYDYTDLDQAALNLLASLNGIVNEDLIKPSHGPNGRPVKSPESLLDDDTAIFADRFPRLWSLISFLESASGEYTLITGPRPIFKLLDNTAGKLAIEQVLAWKELLERTILGAKEFKNINLPAAQPQHTLESPSLQRTSQILLAAWLVPYSRTFDRAPVVHPTK
jgi:hypothetical protein